MRGICGVEENDDCGSGRGEIVVCLVGLGVESAEGTVDRLT